MRLSIQAAAGSVLARSGLPEGLRRLDQFLLRHERALIWCFGILYKLFLDAAYALSVSPCAESMLRPYDPKLVKYLLAFFLYLVLFAALPKRELDSVALIVHLHFVYSVAPLLTFYAFTNGSTRYILMVSACMLLEAVVIFRPLRTASPVRIKGIRSYVTVMLGILTVFALAVPMLYNGFAGLKAFDLDYIYEMRANATYPPGFGYLLSWTTSSFLPFGILCSLHMKKYRWAALLATVQMVFYMQTGSKITLLMLFPMIFIYFCTRTGHCMKMMYLGLSALCLFLVFAYWLDGTDTGEKASWELISFYLVRIIGVRALFLPACIKTYFYEFFSTHPKIFFSDGQIGRMLGLTCPYKLPSGFVVDAYQHGAGAFGVTQANTGYLGEAYAQMGFAGMLLMSLLLALILRSLRVYNRKSAAPLLTALLAVYIIILNDGAFLTTLLTGGLLVTYILIFIYFDKVTEGNGHGIQRL